MNPEDIISDALAKEFPSASNILFALASRGYHIVRAVKFPETISAEYKVHTAGERKVM